MNLLDTLKTASSDAVQILDNNKEKILLGAGIAAGAGTVVLACRATLKAQDIVKDHQRRKETIKEAGEYVPEYVGSPDEKRDILINCANTGIQLAKMYAPSVILGATSVCCLVAQHKLMENKVTKLEETVASVTAAYIAVDTAFRKYRKRVVEKYGEEVDKQLRFGQEEVTVEAVDEKGKTKKKKVKVMDKGDLDISEYAKFFDGTSSQFMWADPMKYNADTEANKRFLVCQQAFANQMLETRGYLFLNEVYEMLGLEPTKAGQVVGWIYDPENPKKDSYVSFGTFDVLNGRAVNGQEECFLLDFNVDGVIIDELKEIADH